MPSLATQSVIALVRLLVVQLLVSWVPLIWIDTYEPNLPPNRFIGKSPEYIEFYTDAYRKQAKSLRTGSAMKGCIVGCIGVSLGGLVLFVQVLSESSFPYVF